MTGSEAKIGAVCIGAAVASKGVSFGLIAVSCVDTDVSLAKEAVDSLPVLKVKGIHSNKEADATYVRGYDVYIVTSSSMVKTSIGSCEISFGMAAPHP